MHGTKNTKFAVSVFLVFISVLYTSQLRRFISTAVRVFCRLKKIFRTKRHRDSSVRIVTKLQSVKQSTSYLFSGKGKRFLLFSKCPDLLHCPPILPVCGQYGCSLRGKGGRRTSVTSYIYLVPNLRMSDCKTPLHTPSWPTYWHTRLPVQLPFTLSLPVGPA